MTMFKGRKRIFAEEPPAQEYSVHPRLQLGQILPGMCRTHEAYQGRPA